LVSPSIVFSRKPAKNPKSERGGAREERGNYFWIKNIFEGGKTMILAGKKSNRMRRHMLLLPVFLVAVVTIILVAAAPHCWADGWWHGGWDDFEVAELYFELNDTDEDLGIHGKIDGGPWKNIWIKDPYYKPIMKVTARGRLRQQAVTELFFESAEPSFDDLDPDDFFDRFPGGYYRIYGWSEDGELLKGKSLIRHVMPAPPGGIEVSGTDIDHKNVDCESETLPEVGLGEDDDVIISWDPVTESHPTIGEDGDIEAVLYQVVVEFDVEVDGEDFESVFSVDLPPSEERMSMTIPRAYINLGLDEDGEGEFKFEILVKEEEGGNQTAAESCFAVVPPEPAEL
jgi:hypothetical protein